MTLAELPWRRPARITALISLSSSELARLSALGVRPGSRVSKIMPTPLRDPIEVLVGPQLLALDAWLLERIEVEAL